MWFKPEQIQPGRRPGALQEQSQDAKISWLIYGIDSLERGRARDFADLPAVPADKTLWLDIQGQPGSAGLQFLQQRYGLHALVLEDIQNGGQTPKLESFPDGLFVVTQLPKLDANELGAVNFHQINWYLADRLLISIHEAPNLFDLIIARLESAKGIIRSAGAEYLLYAQLDLVVDMGFPLGQKIGELIYDLEERIDQAHADLSQEIYRVRRQISALLRQAQRQQQMLRELSLAEAAELSGDHAMYWRDCVDHAERACESLSFHRETVADLLNTHLALMSHRMNDVMKVLTVMSTIFIPLSFIVGLYGMNFDTVSPFNLPELSWRFGYAYVWGLMLSVVVGLLLYFWRKRWLS